MTDAQIREGAWKLFVRGGDAAELMARELADRDISYEDCLAAYKVAYIAEEDGAAWPRLVRGFLRDTGAATTQKEALARAILTGDRRKINE